MIRSLEISNFRSLGPRVRLEPSGLTILVGPNGSGKSNLLDAIAFMRDAVVGGLPAAVTSRHGIDSVRRHSGGHPYNVRIRIALEWGDGAGEYEFEIAGDKTEEYRVKSERLEVIRGQQRHFFERSGQELDAPGGLSLRVSQDALALTTLAGDERFRPFASQIEGMMVYSVYPDTLGRPQPFDQKRPMRPHGENWVSILRDLIKHPEVKDEIVRALRGLTGDIADIRVTRAADLLVVEFRQDTRARKAKQWFSASQQSDGTLRVAGMLTALLQEPPLGVVGIEEPELTVHPGALPLLFDHLRQATERSQVIVTSHSPILLDCCDINRDALFVVEREGGVTRIQRVADETLQPVRDRLLTAGDLLTTGALQLELPETG